MATRLAHTKTAKAFAPKTPPAPLHYRIEAADLHAHLYGVTLTIAQPAAQQQVALPVWIAGSYMVREFAKQLTQLTARQAGRSVSVQQLDKCTWVIDCQASTPLSLHYQVHAHDDSVRTAWLDAQRGFFNGTSVCLQVAGQSDAAHQLELVAESFSPQNAKGPNTKVTASAPWQVATGLTPLAVDARGFGTYTAANYDELVDCPVEMGAFWSGEFKACGIPHRFVVAGATPALDGERLLRDAQKICETAIAFWHGQRHAATPHKRYVFMLNAVANGYGGLEHRNSTALICKRADLPRLGQASSSEGYTTLLGLISHEYFHTWNVKQLRPAEFARYDYARENYTELLWFFEGFTSYYDDLLLHRAGLIDSAQYLQLLGKTISQVQQTPGRQTHSVAQSSFEAWTKYYRPDANSPNLTVSYYGKGALVALCLDLSLRQQAPKQKPVSLDHVMRALWARCCTGKDSIKGGMKGAMKGAMTETDVLAVLQALTGRSWAREIKAWVHGTRELPLADLLKAQGVAVQQTPATLAQRLGLRVLENHSVQIQTVLHGGAAHRAGFAPGDEWLGVEVPAFVAKSGAKSEPRTAATAWRLKQLDDLPLFAGKATEVTALINRDGQLLRLSLNLGSANGAASSAVNGAAMDAAKGGVTRSGASLGMGTFKLSVAQKKPVQQWLASP